MQTKTTLEYLDGYRGFLANTVIIAHLGQHASLGVVSPIVQPIVNAASQHIGVVGFFVLSAFLLTHRLMIDFNNADTLKMYCTKTAQYFIRRFFRIYLVFVVFWTLVHFGPDIFTGYNRKHSFAGYTNGLFLFSVGANHLWTIPVEIKYYFCIPIISFVSIKCGKYWFILWSLSSSAMFYVDFFNPFGIEPWSEFSQKDAQLGSRFTFFFAGSQLAILFFHLEKTPAFRTYATRAVAKNLISSLLNTVFVSEFLIFHYVNKDIRHTKAFQYRVPNRYYIHISVCFKVIAIFFLLYVDNRNLLAKLLNSYYLRMCGRYSFGIYLLHPSVIQAFKTSERYIPIAYHTVIFQFAIARVFTIVGLSYFVAFIWFYLLEDNLMRMANKLAKAIDSIQNGKKFNLQCTIQCP
jgi:peptidoglycan/LPS O-acetylase OafA/YrhL